MGDRQTLSRLRFIIYYGKGKWVLIWSLHSSAIMATRGAFPWATERVGAEDGKQMCLRAEEGEGVG